ncbi:MAG: ATP-binding cassette domain-containing protein [Alphaproteobacteria bacterium]|nr:ATP-binding cassette domain-containing protein [Alphaproteobacteria bacterium]
MADDRQDTGDVLLRMQNVSKTFGISEGTFRRRKDTVRAVDDVTFTLYKGETLGLVGETGSGKSTLGRLALRLLAPDTGRIELEGIDTTRLSQRKVRPLRRKAQMVFQDPYGSLDPRKKVSSIVAEPMIVHGLWGKDGKQRVREIVAKVGLQPEHLDRYPHEFSGGQRQRIGIARAMALNPDLLVLDEPVSALDVSIQAQIINLLRSLQRQDTLTFLFIAHDLAVVRHVSDRVAVMYLGKIVEIGPRDDLYENPKHPYTVSLLSAVPVPDPALERERSRVVLHGEIGSATEIPSGCRFHPRCYKARQMARDRDVETAPSKNGDRLPRACVEHAPELDGGNGHLAACHFPESDSGRAAQPVAKPAAG